MLVEKLFIYLILLIYIFTGGLFRFLFRVTYQAGVKGFDVF